MIHGKTVIVGRPNVGKSTFFNALIGKRQAITHNQAGVTRDCIEGFVQFNSDPSKKYLLIDTGGYETDKHMLQPFSENLVWQKTIEAIGTADLILFLVDTKSGLHAHDIAIMKVLRKTGKKILLAANKIDAPEQEIHASVFWKLGYPEVHFVSAARAYGLKKFTAIIEENLKQTRALPWAYQKTENSLKVSIIGRPNAGKSSILNRLAQKDCSIVSEIAGTTRDCVHTALTYKNKKFDLVDTAGVRRKTKIKETIENFSVQRSLETIKKSQVVVYVIDATEGITDQDMKLINLTIDHYKPLLLVVNKWDLIEKTCSQTQQNHLLDLRFRWLKDLAYLPVHFISCSENKNVHKIFDQVEKLAIATAEKVATSKVNKQLELLTTRNQPNIEGVTNKRIKFYYTAQIESSPPTFVITTNVSNKILLSYQKYIIKGFRKLLSSPNIPIRVIFRYKHAENKKSKLLKKA